MHLLPFLRRIRLAQCLSELRRRLLPAPDPAEEELEGGQLSRSVSSEQHREASPGGS
jgi:hypothetical protein